MEVRGSFAIPRPTLGVIIFLYLYRIPLKAVHSSCESGQMVGQGAYPVSVDRTTESQMSHSSASEREKGGTRKTIMSDSGKTGGSVTKRLQQELMSMMQQEDGQVSAFPSGDSLFHWIGTIKGPSDTAYEGLTYRLSLQFTEEYPFKAPVVRFETGCFHPNVDTQGNICLDILKEKWSAAFSVKSILQSIQSLLGDANVDSPLNTHAAKVWEMGELGREEYRSLVLKMHSS